MSPPIKPFPPKYVPLPSHLGIFLRHIMLTKEEILVRNKARAEQRALALAQNKQSILDGATDLFVQKTAKGFTIVTQPNIWANVTVKRQLRDWTINADKTRECGRKQQIVSYYTDSFKSPAFLQKGTDLPTDGQLAIVETVSTEQIFCYNKDGKTVQTEAQLALVIVSKSNVILTIDQIASSVLRNLSSLRDSTVVKIDCDDRLVLNRVREMINGSSFNTEDWV